MYIYKPTSEEPLVFVTVDRFGKRIFLAKSRFEDHIIHPITGHKELTGNEQSIKEVVEDPNIILESTKFNTSWLYIGKSNTSTYPALNVTTVVSHISPDYGYVVTSFFQRDEDINVEKERARVIYEK